MKKPFLIVLMLSLAAWLIPVAASAAPGGNGKGKGGDHATTPDSPDTGGQPDGGTDDGGSGGGGQGKGKGNGGGNGGGGTDDGTHDKVTLPPTDCSGDGNDLRVWPDKNGNYPDSYIVYLADGSELDMSPAPDRGDNYNGLGYHYWGTAPTGYFLNVTHVVAVVAGIPSVKVDCNITQISPIAIDVDGSGAIELLDGEFRVELTGDNSHEVISQWFGPSDAILLNSESYGANRRGGDLFGDEGGTFADGFVKLALLDADGDGMVSGKELDGLMLWIDADSNTKAQRGELHSLADFGIVALSTSHDGSFVSTATAADGSTMHVEDIWFSEVAK